MRIKETAHMGDRMISIETGWIAKQADGAAVVQCGDTVVLATVVADKSSEPSSFLPLTVEYIEKMYAAGRIPGGFFRREGRQSTLEILTCRLIDRPIRPLFAKHWASETQVIALVLSVDKDNPPDVLAITAVSSALSISNIPWNGPIAGIRVGRVDGRFVANPSETMMKSSDMNLVVACSFDAVVMVEGEARFVQESDIVSALEFAREQCMPVLELQEKLKAECGKPKRPVPEFITPEEATRIIDEIQHGFGGDIAAAFAVREKLSRYEAIDKVFERVCSHFGEIDEKRKEEIEAAFETVKKRYVRGRILAEGRRIDGRTVDEIRPITCEVSLLPRAHGSALFTRGETQALATTTLATHMSDQRVESVLGDFEKPFLLHYNFPPFSTGEIKRVGSPGRREIGHGNLAERALSPILPAQSDFPYAIRLVSEILESNGSSSMATVCGGTLALMDAGVPIQHPVAGIAMGLIKEGDQFAVLSDILGDEDHLGDMDFKVAGTRDGITAIQMDIKISGLSVDILHRALDQAKRGRLHILEKMTEALCVPRTEMSLHAPRITTIHIKPDKIRDIIGPGGKMIRAIQDESGATLTVSDDGSVSIAAVNDACSQKAIQLVRNLTAEAEVGVVYRGIVRRVTDFGAFVMIIPGTDGLCHISGLDFNRVGRVEDICREGDQMVVKVLNIDREGKIRLSRKAAFDTPETEIQNML